MRPEESKPPEGERRLRSLHDARYLGGTPLRLVWWWHVAFGAETRETGEFSLVAADGREVWSLQLTDDYTVLGDEQADDALEERVKRLGALLEVGPEGRFSLWKVATRERLEFEARRVEDEPGWEVVQLSSRPYDPEEPPAGEAEVELPALELRSVARIPLGGEHRATDTEAPNLGPIDQFDFGADGGFRVVRAEEEPNAFTVLALSRKGEVLRETRFGPVEQAGRLVWWPLAGGRWFVTDFWATDESASWFADEATGELTPLPETWPCSIHDVAAADDGGFLALVTFHSKYTLTDAVFRLDAAGGLLWRLDEEFGDDPAKLFSPESVAVTPAGEAAVLDNIAKKIQLFDANGAFLHALDLEAVLGKEPSYSAGLSRDPAGSLLLYVGGKPPLYRLSTGGEVSARLALAPEGGRPVGSMDDLARIAPDGEMWTTDGHALYRVDAAGKFVETIGTAPAADTLSSLGATAIDWMGRILIRDEETNVLHAFDADGNTLFRGAAEAGDFEDWNSRELFVDAEANLYAQSGRGGGFVQFSPGGVRQGPVSLGSDRIAFQADGTRWIEISSYKEYELRHLSEQGGVLASVRRTPDGRWLEGVRDFAVNAAGELHVLHSTGSSEGSKAKIAIYGPGGEPKATLDAPGAPGGNLALSARWLLVGRNEDATLVRRSDRAAFRFVLPEPDVSIARFGFSPRGDELWAIAAEGPTLYRYELP